MFGIFKPMAHIDRLSSDKIDSTYVYDGGCFLGIFVGYAGYCSSRLRLAMPYLIEQGFSRGELGVALAAVSIAYGLSKFLMGSVSDRSNPLFPQRRLVNVGTVSDVLLLVSCHGQQAVLLLFITITGWLVSRYGLASLWANNLSALVVT